MDKIEELFKTGRSAPRPEHDFQIMFQAVGNDSVPTLVDMKQIERDAKEYSKNKENLLMSENNEPIRIDPKKYPSPHMIIFDPVTDYKELEKFGGKCVKLGEGGTTFDQCMEISKLPEDVKSKFTDEIIKIIKKNYDEKKQE